MQVKYFYHFAESWYANQNKTSLHGGAYDDILIGFEEPKNMSVIPEYCVVKKPIEDCSCGEVRIAWYNGHKKFSTLEIQSNAFPLLATDEIQDLIMELRYLADDNEDEYCWDVEDIKSLLLDLGFIDATKTDRSHEQS